MLGMPRSPWQATVVGVGGHALPCSGKAKLMSERLDSHIGVRCGVIKIVLYLVLVDCLAPRRYGLYFVR